MAERSKERLDELVKLNKEAADKVPMDQRPKWAQTNKPGKPPKVEKFKKGGAVRDGRTGYAK